MKLGYESFGRDLYAAAVECKCLDPKWKDTTVSHLFKRKIKLVGYYDDNFFDNVHKVAHSSKCDCGRGFVYQWFRDGVGFEWVD